MDTQTVREIIVVLGPIVGVLVGAIGTIGVTWITKHYEEQSSYRKLVIETSLEYFREALISARNSIKGTGGKASVWPLESFVISMSHLMNRVVNKKFNINNIDDVVSENKKLREALEKLYEEGEKKGKTSTPRG